MDVVSFRDQLVEVVLRRGYDVHLEDENAVRWALHQQLLRFLQLRSHEVHDVPVVFLTVFSCKFPCLYVLDESEVPVPGLTSRYYTVINRKQGHFNKLLVPAHIHKRFAEPVRPKLEPFGKVPNFILNMLLVGDHINKLIVKERHARKLHRHKQ